MPRPPFAAFVVLLIIAAALLFRSSFSARSSYYRDVFGHRHSLSAWLSDEEARYALAVQDRQDLISKLRPKQIVVESFPTHGEDYTLCADLFHRGLSMPASRRAYGTLGDGGKWVCGLDRVAKQDKCVVYSFGINGESSFEAALLKRAPGCEAWGYDYSVTSWGPEINDDAELRERAHFQAWALGGTDKHGENDNPKYWTLDSLMKFNGLTSFIDAHAADGEYLPVGQLQLEIHVNDKAHERFHYFVNWWASLEAAGLRPFWTEANLVYLNRYRGVPPDITEYSFINIRGNHALVNEAFN
ncbi:hypothetical protein BJV74DRAFT_839390 [Russula compacta]|nr:hypothetical protein BJV74DRAFT_839390 [Russula compacta]